MSQVYKSYQKPLDHNDLWHNLDDNMVYVFDKNKNEWKPISNQDGSSNPGFSPVVSINKVGTKTEIKITDSEGDHIANIYDGQDGPKGDPGDDGVSPTIQAERVSNGVKLTITDKNGSHSAVLNDGIGNGSTVSTFADVPSDGKSYLRQNGTWVEGATKAELNNLGSKVGGLPYSTDIEEQGYAIGLADENGNIAFAIDDKGNIISKLFNSANSGQGGGNVESVDDDSDNIWSVGDANGYIIVCIDKDGNLKTPNFDSTQGGNTPHELNGLKVLIVGDSVTYGQGLSDLNQRWASRLTNKYNWQSVISAVGGCPMATDASNRDSFVTRLETQLITNNFKPDLIIVGGGSNDISYRPSPFGDITDIKYFKTLPNVTTPPNKTTWCGALAYINYLRLKYCPNASIFFWSLHNFASRNWTTTMSASSDKTVQDMYDAQQKASQELGFNWIDMRECPINPENGKANSMTFDGSHPNLLGTEQMVAFFSKQLETRFVKAQTK